MSPTKVMSSPYFGLGPLFRDKFFLLSWKSETKELTVRCNSCGHIFMYTGVLAMCCPSCKQTVRVPEKYMVDSPGPMLVTGAGANYKITVMQCATCAAIFEVPENAERHCPKCNFSGFSGTRVTDDVVKLEMVNHPKHYNALGAKCHHCGGDIECIDVVEAMSYNVGSAVKYCWRMDEKFNDVEDIKKAIWYLQRELENREKKNSDG